MWSDELFLQLLNVTFFSQSDHTIGFCEKFPWIWKKNQLSTTNGSEVMAVWSFWSRRGLEGYIMVVQKKVLQKTFTKNDTYDIEIDKKCIALDSTIFLINIGEKTA